jgi:DHA2 family lincomycin resistance protein-like MFS transporter
MQQVAAAAGTALFIAIMSSVVVTAIGQGDSLAKAYADGIHMAFLLSASIASLSIIPAFFIKKAKATAGAVGH